MIRHSNLLTRQCCCSFRPPGNCVGLMTESGIHVNYQGWRGSWAKQKSTSASNVIYFFCHLRLLLNIFRGQYVRLEFVGMLAFVLNLSRTQNRTAATLCGFLTAIRADHARRASCYQFQLDRRKRKTFSAAPNSMSLSRAL